MLNKLKKIILTSALLGLSSHAFAGLIAPTSVSSTGTFNNSLSLLTDGSYPAEGGQWQTNTVWWRYQENSAFLSFDYGSVFNIEEVRLSVDNNDSYRVDYSTDNSTWNSLFSISWTYGEIGWGMDTMDTDSTKSEYISQIDFGAVNARYLRILATGGDNKYSVGELQMFGSSSNTSVPEPGSLLLLSAGLLGLRFARKR